jgi:hypothetical protein
VTRASFLCAAVSSKSAPELKSNAKPARGNERLKIDFMAVSKSKRKRESATDISDIKEARQLNKNSKDRAFIERPYGAHDDLSVGDGALRSRRKIIDKMPMPRRVLRLDRVSLYQCTRDE